MARESRPKPLWIRLIGGFLYLVLCGLVLAGGAAAGWMGKTTLGTRVFATILNPPKVGNSDIFEGKSSVNVLILGCDQDLYYGGKQVLLKQARSDMMLVARLDFNRHEITGVSIPRDTLCAVPGYSEQKINAYHAIGARKNAELGKQLSKEAVETLLPVKIDRVLVIDYDAFQKMVNQVGGVTLYVDKRMKYTDKAGGLFINFKPGKQHLDGYQSMCFVRYRHGDDDFHRQARQREFLMAFKDAMLKDMTALPAVAEEAKHAIGDGFGDDEIIALAHFVKGVTPDNIQIGMIPVVDAANYNLRVNESELRPTLAKFHLIEDKPGTGRA